MITELVVRQRWPVIIDHRLCVIEHNGLTFLGSLNVKALEIFERVCDGHGFALNCVFHRPQLNDNLREGQ